MCVCVYDSVVNDCFTSIKTLPADGIALKYLPPIVCEDSQSSQGDCPDVDMAPFLVSCLTYRGFKSHTSHRFMRSCPMTHT